MPTNYFRYDLFLVCHYYTVACPGYKWPVAPWFTVRLRFSRRRSGREAGDGRWKAHPASLSRVLCLFCRVKRAIVALPSGHSTRFNTPAALCSSRRQRTFISLSQRLLVSRYYLLRRLKDLSHSARKRRRRWCMLVISLWVSQCTMLVSC